MDLSAANQNPWYILMTLHGEQVADSIDEDLAEKNRTAWNKWASQGITAEQRADIVSATNLTVSDFTSNSGEIASIKELHRLEWIKRNTEDLPYPEFPQCGKPIFVNQTFFENTIFCASYCFRTAVLFDDSHFEKNVVFDDCLFLKVSSIKRCDFKNMLSCKNAVVRSELFFDDSNFTQTTRFDKTQFASDVTFFDSKFLDTAYFSNSKFQQSCHFASAKFTNGCDYYSAKFSGFVYFHGANFSCREATSEVDFSDAIFERPINFRGANFPDKYPVFRGTIIGDKIDVDASEAYWPKKPNQEPIDAKESCGIIRHSMGEQGRPEDQHFFFRREMSFASQTGSTLSRMPYKIFGAASDFGYSIQKPVFLLGMLWLIPAIIFQCYFNWRSVIEEHSTGWHSGITLSFSNIFTFFGFQRTYIGYDFINSLNPFIQFIGSIQTILGFILIFLLGLALRTRFRLR